MIDTGRGPKTFTLADVEEFVFVFDDMASTVPTLAVVSKEPADEPEDSKPHKLWIVDRIDNPLIVQMDLGWTIKLASVTPAPTDGPDAQE